MAIKEITAFADSANVLHRSKEDAILADLERALGKSGGGESVIPGIARQLIENRAIIIDLLGQCGPDLQVVVPTAALAA